jgi:hypothetical protein
MGYGRHVRGTRVRWLFQWFRCSLQVTSDDGSYDYYGIRIHVTGRQTYRYWALNP